MLTIYVKFNSFLELSDTTITVHNVEVFILLSFLCYSLFILKVVIFFP